MKKIISILTIGLLLTSCYKGKFEKSQQTLDSLLIVNENLINSINLLEKRENERNLTKYVWTAIYHKRGTYTWSPGKSGSYGDVSNYIYYSEVKSIPKFTDEKKFRLQDELENELKKNFGRSVHSIQRRETFVFNSYEEASSHRYKTIN